MDSILYVGITHAVFVALFMLSKRPNHLSDRVCSIWMLFLALPLISRLFNVEFPNLVIPGFSSITCYPLTFGPFLLLYTTILIHEHPVIKRRNVWHFLPFLLFALLQMLFPTSFLPPGSGPQQPSMLHWLHVGATFLSLLGYTAIVRILLKHHENHVLEYFSDIPISITLRWLHWLTFTFVTIYGFVLLLDLVFPLLPLPPPLPPDLFHALAFTGFIFVFSFFSLKQPRIFQQAGQESDVSEHVQETETSVQEKPGPKYEKSGLTTERAQEYLQRLEAYVQHEKPYLNANLTLEELAKSLSIPRHYLTQVLNEQLHKNFYTYINEYRVAEVKRHLRDPNKAHVTLLSIAYDSGFNSKSTFNTVFKKFTNITPSQFRKLHAPKEGME